MDLRISNRQDSETDTNGSKHSELPLTCPFNALVKIACGGGGTFYVSQQVTGLEGQVLRHSQFPVISN